MCRCSIKAARLFGAAGLLAERIGMSFHLPERVAYDRAQAAIRDEVGDNRYETAWEEGRKLTGEVAVAEALEFLATWDEAIVAASAPASADDFGLTPRERDVLCCLATGNTDREIAAALYVSPRTIQTHVAHIRKKLGVHSRTEAASLAFRHNLV